MPPQRRSTQQDPAPETTPATPEAPQEVALEVGQHNPYLAGLIKQGKETEDAIRQWYARRGALREQARGAVTTGFASPEQVKQVEEVWPMPKRGKKDDAPATDEAPAAS